MRCIPLGHWMQVCAAWRSLLLSFFFCFLETWQFQRYSILQRRSRPCVTLRPSRPFVTLQPFSMHNNLECRRCTNWANYHIHESHLTGIGRHCVSAMTNRKVDFIIECVLHEIESIILDEFKLRFKFSKKQIYFYEEEPFISCGVSPKKDSIYYLKIELTHFAP